MVNTVWLFLMVTGVLIGLSTGKSDLVTKVALSSAGSAVNLALGLIGIIGLWSGVMKIAEESGLTRVMGNLLRPVMRFIFPTIPAEHPAMSAIIMGTVANILGMGNAATPLGLKAMEEMQKLNKNGEEASDAMCTFLALTLSGLTLMPTSVLAIRAQAGSRNPAEVVGPIILVTLFSTVVTLTADRILQRITSPRNRRQ